MLLQSDRGRASWHGTGVALEAPALLWLPGSIEATVEVGPGAHGFLLSVDDDFLIKIVAGNAEALHLRRTTERVALVAGEALAAVSRHDRCNHAAPSWRSCARRALAARR